MNVLYTTNNKVGFLKFLEATPGSITCDAGSQYELVDAFIDAQLSTLVYAATTNGEILIFE